MILLKGSTLFYSLLDSAGCPTLSMTLSPLQIPFSFVQYGRDAVRLQYDDGDSHGVIIDATDNGAHNGATMPNAKYFESEASQTS